MIEEGKTASEEKKRQKKERGVVSGAWCGRVSYKRACVDGFLRLRPYHPENARSRPISEAKQGRAWLVLGWETAWEYQVL